MPTPKTTIIEALFRDQSRWRDGTVGGALIRPTVMMSEVQQAISNHNANASPNEKLSDRNPANFFKDFVRITTSAEKNWPQSVLVAGYTAVQQTGAGKCFKFIPLPEGQTTAFHAMGAVYPKSPDTTSWEIIQTLSLDVMVKALARKDENWLQRVAVDLNIPQAHLALHPIPKLQFEQVGHIQSNLKLRNTEIDGLYYGYLKGGHVALVTMEAKGDSDDILESQLLDQIDAIQNMEAVTKLLAFMKTTPADTIILPMAMKIVRPGHVNHKTVAPAFKDIAEKLLYMAHYEPIPFNKALPTSIKILSETIFNMRPPIPGIND